MSSTIIVEGKVIDENEVIIDQTTFYHIFFQLNNNGTIYLSGFTSFPLNIYAFNASNYDQWLIFQPNERMYSQSINGTFYETLIISELKDSIIHIIFVNNADFTINLSYKLFYGTMENKTLSYFSPFYSIFIFSLIYRKKNRR